MKKNLLLVFVFISIFGYSQQAAEGHYQNTGITPDEVIQLQIRNGSNLSNILGSNNFGSGSQQSGSAGFYLPSTQKYYSSSNTTPFTNFTAPNKNIGNGIGFSLSANEKTLQNFIADDGSGENFDAKPLVMKTIRYDSSINGTSGDGQWDISETIVTLIKQTNSNSLLPVNCWYIQSSPECDDFSTGANTNGSKTIAFKFTDLGSGNFQWVKQTTWPDGTPLDIVQNLSNEDFATFVKAKMNVYPNPTKKFISIQNQENSTENFGYKIVDLTGRIVKNGNSKFNEQINIESLTSGNYIIQIQTDSNQFITQKLIKN